MQMLLEKERTSEEAGRERVPSMGEHAHQGAASTARSRRVLDKSGGQHERGRSKVCSHERPTASI